MRSGFYLIKHTSSYKAYHINGIVRAVLLISVSLPVIHFMSEAMLEIRLFRRRR
jgi:uncharacterized membrane protein YGL010W